MKFLVTFLILTGFITPEFSMAQPAELKTLEGCFLYHPELPWQQPSEASWSGGCAGNFAVGYGWYRFNLSGEGFPDTRVEIFMHFDGGAPANEFYYARMSTRNQTNYEGYAEFGGYQVTAEECTRRSDCSLVFKAKENDGKPPIPPTRPSTPPTPPTAPSQPPRQDAPELSPLQATKNRFLRIVQEQIPIKARSLNTDNPTRAQAITSDFNVFASKWTDYANFICQRSGRELEQCEQYQLNVMIGILLRALDEDFETTYPPTNAFSDYGNSVCAHHRSWQEGNNCVNDYMNKRISALRKMHPKAMSVAVDAIAYYASAMLQLQGYTGGSTYQVEVVYLRERMLQFVFEQAHANWKN